MRLVMYGVTVRLSIITVMVIMTPTLMGQVSAYTNMLPLTVVCVKCVNLCLKVESLSS